jgi:hypothetical protein
MEAEKLPKSGSTNQQMEMKAYTKSVLIIKLEQ